MRQVSGLGVIVAIAIVAGAAFAQTEPKVFVAPNNGQSAEQQSKDSAECKQVATEQAPPAQGATGTGTHVRDAAGGAAKGAAMGAAVGAIADDPGKGAAAGAAVGGVAARRNSKKGQEAAAAGAQSDWGRAFAACMESRGYTVK